MIRTGLGFDTHRYTQGSGIVIGGVIVPCDKKIVAYSDGDVLLHALCDALLGAGAAGDIGTHFPNSPEHKDRSSRDFVKEVMRLLREKQLQPVNLDMVLIAETPKFLPFIKPMRQNIATDTDLEIDCVSIKATTTDQMGFIGRGDGIAAIASVLLKTFSKGT